MVRASLCAWSMACPPVPLAGYLQVLPRLAASCALLVPLRWAPLVMNGVGLLVQALPVPILLSRRMAHWAGLPLRLLMASPTSHCRTWPN